MDEKEVRNTSKEPDKVIFSPIHSWFRSITLRSNHPVNIHSKMKNGRWETPCYPDPDDVKDKPEEKQNNS